MTARVLMVQGTASDVGKSLLTAGLCRLFRRRGLSVAPFKAQNLSLNAAVTLDGLELGRAQAMQAEAARVVPHVDMNPVLLKPTGASGAQVVLHGVALDPDEARALRGDPGRLAAEVTGSLDRLRARHDLVLAEGAGSPAEVNLRDRDVSNMHVALHARCPVLLVGDIERGGVFAHLVGTLALLSEEERALVAGLVVNRFRGDRTLLDPGPAWLAERTGVPVLGVVPHVPDLALADEDALALDRGAAARARAGEDGGARLRVAVVHLPHLSNFDDFRSLQLEPEVDLAFVRDPAELAGAQLVVLPGTKDTRGDLRWLRARGFEPALRAHVAADRPLLGVCGGYQMLGRAVHDPDGVEGPAGSEPGLELLPVETRFEAPKVTRRTRLRPGPGLAASCLGRMAEDHASEGYEIHVGRVVRDADAPAMLRVEVAGDAGAGTPASEPEGAVRGPVCGTLQHGLLEDAPVRAALLSHLRGERTGPVPPSRVPDRDAEYDRLADVLEAELDLALLERLVDGSWRPGGTGR